ncbi:hypothetical protein E4T50_04818 [Aureobasidium sp. EXF-12298]|nr:hypothetical protein E4T50_04818 [Aureobasidium sp. EXF-12298]KAI4762445.1 hypothetical protein E4T51_04581 [Aureobasidium sp. EXF-12344]KAI4779685.1 hypothetical protein E4T52_05402 [Aureobasidium sp. EXF-3400]
MPRSSKRQTRLTFDPLPTSSPAPSDMSKSVRDRAATVRFEGANPAKRRKVRDTPGAPSLTSAITPDVPEKSLPPTPDLTGLTNSFGASVVSDDEIRPTQRLSSRKSQKKQQKLDLTPSSPRAINNARPVRAGFFGTQQQAEADSSDGSDSLPKLPIRSQNQKKSKRQKKHRSPPPAVEEEEVVQALPTVISDDDESEDDLPITPAVNRKRKRQAGSSSPLALISDDEDDDSDVVVTGSRKRSQSTKKQASPPQSESDPDDEPPSSRSRKRLRRVKDSAPMSTITEEERQDLEDDLVDLASSGSDTEVRVSQRNKSSQKNARQLALERLKARRKAPMSSIVEVEDGEDEDEDQVDDEEEDYNQSSDEEEEDDDLPEPSTNRTTRKQMFAEDEDDEGFVIDDDGPLGVPTNVPIAFTRYASMKAKDLFRFAIDWMVQKKINPAFQMDDEIYDLTFKKLDDEVKGLAGSKFQSAAWTSKFTLALQARPDLLSARLDRQSSAHFGRDKCDACNRSGHPATYEVKFEGKPYDKNSLEPVAPRKATNDDSDEDDDSDESSIDENAPVNYDSQGRKILPEETVFYLGKFCMSNAETAHSLQHWRYHLYEWVVEYLESAGWNTPKLIVKRDGWSVRKRRKHANKIVDIMEEQGKIKALYSDFKKEIDPARNAKQGRWDSSP